VTISNPDFNWLKIVLCDDVGIQKQVKAYRRYQTTAPLFASFVLPLKLSWTAGKRNQVRELPVNGRARNIEKSSCP
jgi:hypothetical protein